MKFYFYKLFIVLKIVVKRIKYIREFPKITDSDLQRFSTWDKDLGWCPKPGMRKRDSVYKKSAQPPFWTIDKKGSRIAFKQKSTNGKSLSIYGDSFAMSREVHDDETIAWQFGEIFDTYCANYGVGNYGLDQSLLRLEKCIGNDRTDFVCIVVCIATMSRTVGIFKHWLEIGNTLGVKPRAYIGNNGKLSFLPNPVERKEDIKKLRLKREYLIKFDGNYKNFRKNRWDIFGRKVQQYNLQLWDENKELFYSLMEKYNSIAERYNFKPVFVLLADKENAKRRINGEVLQYQSVIKESSLKFPEINFYDLTLDLYNEIDFDKAYITNGEGHFSSDANFIIAKMIGDRIFKGI